MSLSSQSFVEISGLEEDEWSHSPDAMRWYPDEETENDHTHHVAKMRGLRQHDEDGNAPHSL